MYSVKPGRGPSIMGGVAALLVAGFGVFWILLAHSIGAPWPFLGFGLIFIAFALTGAIYNFANATQKNRSSVIDITTDSEEGDFIADALGHSRPHHREPQDAAEPVRQFEGDFCPYCGAQVQPDFNFCPKCGKDI